MSSVEYLQEYYPFTDGVMAAVEVAAAGQRDLSWPEYVAKNNIPDLIKYNPPQGKQIEVLDIVPENYDGTYVYHMPMGCLLDSNTMTHTATIAKAAPDKRVIAVSNPGQPFHGSGKLGVLDAGRVWGGNLEPTVAPTLWYLRDHRMDVAVEAIHHLGESHTEPIKLRLQLRFQSTTT